MNVIMKIIQKVSDVTYINDKDPKFPREVGIGPDRLLWYKSKLTSFVRLPNSVGIVPLILLPNTSLQENKILMSGHAIAK